MIVDGVSIGRSASLPSLSLVTTNARNHESSDIPQTAKSVTFIPLSPRSSRTLERHHAEQEAVKQVSKEASSDGDNSHVSTFRAADSEGYFTNLVTNDMDAEDFGTGGGVIEVLPDRFDSQGQPLDQGERSMNPLVHTRRGEFQYRSPRGSDGLQMQGQWGGVGTDPEAVERVVRNVTGVLEGRGSWLALLGSVLGGGLLQNLRGQDAIYGGKEGKRREVRERRSWGLDENGRRRSMSDYNRGDVAGDYFYDGEKRRNMKYMTRGGKRREWNDRG